MLAPSCLRVVQRSLARPSRRCVRSFSSSSSSRFLRHHRDSGHERDGDPSDRPPAELLEPSDETDDPLEGLLEEEEHKAPEVQEDTKTTFPLWLKDVAQEFQDPKPRNWLGGKVVSRALVLLSCMS